MDAPRKRLFATRIDSMFIAMAAAAMSSAVRIPLQSLKSKSRRQLTSSRLNYFTGRRSQYKPHQGKAERARRVRQMANGTHGY
jgi:hypothetical protein